MAAELPPSKKRSWKDSAKPGTERKNEAQKAWRREATAPPKGKRPWSRRSKLGLLGLLFLGVVGVIVAVILWIRPPKPVYLVLIGAGYEENLAIPHNVYGMVTLRRLGQLAEANDKLFRLDRRAPAAWKTALDTFQNEGKEKTVVLCLSLHGGADRQGPYLLFDQPTPTTDGDGALRITDLLAELAKLPADKKKVLILDATQTCGTPRLMVHNDFSRRLKKLDEAIRKIDNLVVLNSADACQRSWASEEWRQTAFGYYLQEGLKGGADQDETGGNGDGRVTALELYRFVRHKVERWAHANRDAAQQPVLLPLGEEGERRAGAMELALVQKGYQAPAVPKAPALDFTKLHKKWRAADALLKRVPSPAVYTPHLLRHYLETLLRYEQLLRAGAGDFADRLAAQLDDTRARLEQGQRLQLSSRQNSLAMPAALGLLATDPAAGGNALFDELWRAPRAKRPLLWRKLPGRRDPWLRLRLSAWLLRRATDDPAANLKQAGDILRQLIDDPKLRPTEAHHMAMWARDLDRLYANDLPPADLLKSALRTRRLAERAALGLAEGKFRHPYSEAVFPWIGAQVNKADELRRRGQDLLFSSSTKDRNEAGKLLRDSEDLYGQALKTSARVRQALEVRAEVMSRLPFYSQWLVRRRPADDGQLTRFSRLFDLAEGLWEKVHRLNDLLGAPPATRKLADSVTQLDRLTRTIGQDYRDIQGRFDRHSKDPLGTQLQENWHAIDAALAVPFIDAPQRIELLRKARQISLELNRHTKQKEGEAPTGSAAETRRQAQQSAYRRARLALATLGRERFPKSEQAGREDYAQVKRWAVRIQDKGWEEAAVDVGGQVALRWRVLAEEVNALAKTGRTQTDLAKARVALARAERLCRLSDGPAADQVKPIDPVEEKRRLDMYRLLVWQARRTCDDKWFDEACDDKWFDENPNPYYRAAGMKYVRDAKSLRTNKGASRAQTAQRLADAVRVEKLLRLPVDLAFRLTAGDNDERRRRAQLHITSEPAFDLDYRVRPAGLKSGTPVIFAEPRDMRAADATRLKEWRAPRSWEVGSKDRPLALTGLKNPYYQDLFKANVPPAATPEPKEQSWTVYGLFRGYRFRLETAVKLHPRANTIVYQYPLPDKAGVLFYATEDMHRRYSPRRGALAILVDYSGSMGWKTAPGRTRIGDARAALEKVLDTLPENLNVSLWAFRGYPTDKKVPVKIRKIAQTKNWAHTDIKKFKAALAKQKAPKGGTPLLEAMTKAKEELKRFKRGRRTMVIVTDGVPNDPKKYKGKGNKLLQKELRKVFKGSGILVHVVGFHVKELKDKDEKAILPKFIDGIENLETPGMFHPVADPEGLIKILNDALKWKYQLLKPGTNVKKAKKKDVPRGEVDREDRLKALLFNTWLPLDPKRYEFWEDKLYQDQEKLPEINVAAGDLRVYELTEPKLRRAVVTNWYPSGKDHWPRDENDNWQLAVRNNRLVNPKSQDVLVMVENLRELEDPRPNYLWLELQDKSGKPVTGQRWGNRLGYPAPTWGLEATRFQEKSTVRAWARDTASGGQRVERPARQPLAAFDGLTPEVDNVKVRIESVRLEEFPLVDPLGKRREKKTWCVVVRLSYPQGSPVFAQPYTAKNAPVDPRRGGGYEHHFYEAAGRDKGKARGKYTGIFWYGEMGKAEAEVLVQGLTLYSVNQFKRDPLTARLEHPLGRPNDRVPVTQRYLWVLGLEKHSSE
jgi:Mg-chelatase subunit ChlD